MTLFEHLSEAAKVAKVAKLGSGKRFSSLVKQLQQRSDVEDPEALAAWLGRKTHGAQKMASLALKARWAKRSAKRRKK